MHRIGVHTCVHMCTSGLHPCWCVWFMHLCLHYVHSHLHMVWLGFQVSMYSHTVCIASVCECFYVCTSVHGVCMSVHGCVWVYVCVSVCIRTNACAEEAFSLYSAGDNSLLHPRAAHLCPLCFCLPLACSLSVPLIRVPCPAPSFHAASFFHKLSLDMVSMVF